MSTPHMIYHEPSVLIRRLLEQEWNTSNIGGPFDPDKRISTGWWDDDNPKPQITVTPQSDDTSYTGIHPGGHGPASRPSSTLMIDLWVQNEGYDSSANQWNVTGVHPKTFRWHLRREVDRILWDHANGWDYTDTDGNTSSLTRIEPDSSQPFVDPEIDEKVLLRWRLATVVRWYQNRA